jgi:YD repeat-containing protein
MHEQDTIALACVIDALGASIDPTGRVTARMCDALAHGLAITDEAGRKSEAAEAIRSLIDHLTSEPDTP